jgi:hypothetical protein
MCSESIDPKQCLCYSQDKLLEKQTHEKSYQKAAQYNKKEEVAHIGFHQTLTIRPWFIQHNKPLFDGKVGDASYQLLRRFSLFCPVMLMI